MATTQDAVVQTQVDPAKSQRKPEAAPHAKIDDDTIKHAVMHRLVLEGVFPRASVDVAVKQGIVELSGSALSLFAKNQAKAVVATTRGVRGYIDSMTVTRTDIPDDELKQNISQALLFDPATEAYEVDLQVKDGVVELRGEVDSWAERELVESRTASVMGVRDITNLLKIDTPAVRPEKEIVADITSRLQNDVRVDAELVDIGVKGGVVTLKGIVGSLAEEYRAIHNAWVAGVSRVNSELKIEWWERDRFVATDITALKPDVEVKDAVEAALRFDAQVLHKDVDVFVDRGRVTLTGSVPNLYSKRRAVETAGNTLGVTRVRNYLSVQPADDLKDQRLQERVERALNFSPYLAEWDGIVSAKGGVVYLNGMVNTEKQKREAAAVASRVGGVMSVENNLRVYLKTVEDRALEDDIDEQLTWSIFVDRNGIDVAVSQGAVTLAGEVHDLRAYRQAVAAARAAGAEVVYNRLKIVPRTKPKQEPDGS